MSKPEWEVQGFSLNAETRKQVDKLLETIFDEFTDSSQKNSAWGMLIGLLDPSLFNKLMNGLFGDKETTNEPKEDEVEAEYTSQDAEQLGYDTAKQSNNWFSKVNMCPFGPSYPGDGNDMAAAWYRGFWRYWRTHKKQADIDNLGEKTAKNEMLLVCDDLDFEVIKQAMAARQCMPLPDHGSNDQGALIAEICRGWLEYTGEL